MGRDIAALIAALILAAVPATGHAQSGVGDPMAGRQVAQTWCSNCHSVEVSAQTLTTDVVPSFAAIARNPTMPPSVLRAFLQHPHGQMPDLYLSRPEIDDLIAYIRSLPR